MPETTPATKLIVQNCEHSPPNHVDAHPRLFDDLDDESLHETLFQLWQKGIVNAEWVEEDEETAWWLTEFGEELCDKGLADAYIQATEHEIELDASPRLLADPEEVA